jgi:hypothetical protein
LKVFILSLFFYFMSQQQRIKINSNQLYRIFQLTAQFQNLIIQCSWTIL